MVLLDKTKYIEAKSTPLTEAQAAYALREAWKTVFGEYPEDKCLAIIWAQTALETGRFKKDCYNYCFGNIRLGKKWDGYWQMYKCSEIEIVGGKRVEVFYEPPHPNSIFRAFTSVEDGAFDHIKFLARPNYSVAVSFAKKGDAKKYTEEIKKQKYFTAGLDRYIKDMVSLSKEFMRRKDELLSWTPPVVINPSSEEPRISVEETLMDFPEDLEELVMDEMIITASSPGKQLISKPPKPEEKAGILATLVAWVIKLLDRFH